jgi:hypothetical protein
MMITQIRLLDGILRSRPISATVAACVVVAAGMFYGAVMGAFTGNAAPRPVMMLFASLKVPLLLLVTFVLSVPSWYVLHLLLGLGDDVLRALRAVITSQAVLTLVLMSLAPLVVLWYASIGDYPLAILFNGLMFALASLGAHIALRTSYAPLIGSNPRHRWTLRVWLVLYVFVGIQMAWVLRPFIGDPTAPVSFFRTDAWDNAYVFVVSLVWKVLMRD